MPRRELWWAVLCCLALGWFVHRPVLGGDSWPYNHEFGAVFERTEQFRRAFVEGDFLPVWSTTAYQGHGGPVPLLYHRGFYWLAGWLALPLGAYQASLLGMVLVTALGALGAWRTAWWFGAGRLGGAVAAFFLVASQYYTTDWLIRGAEAETFAMAMLPWAIFYGARFANGERVAGRWALTIAALFHAHQVVATFCLLPLAPLGVVGAWRHGGAGWRKAARELAVFFAVLLPLTVPWLMAIRALHPYFDLEVTQRNGHPLREYKPLLLLWRDDAFRWGAQWRGYSVELGRALVVAGGVGAACMLLMRRHWRLWGALLLSAAWAFWLQSEASRPLYETSHWAGFLMFPWRMNTLLTVVLAIAAAVPLALTRHVPWARVVVAALLMCAVAMHCSRLLEAQRLNYEQLAPDFMTRVITAPDAGGGGEYLPRGVGVVPGPFIKTDGCTVTPMDRPSHFTRLALTVDATGPCWIDIGQYRTPLISVEGAERVETNAIGDMRVLVPAGTTTVTLKVKSFFAVISWFFSPPA